MNLKQFIWLTANIYRRKDDSFILINSTLFVSPKNKTFMISFPEILLQYHYNVNKLLN